MVGWMDCGMDRWMDGSWNCALLKSGLDGWMCDV